MTDGPNRLPRTPKGARAGFHSEAGVDQLFGIVAALAAELWAARERIDTLERLLEQAQVVSSGGVERFEPDSQAIAARQAERDAFIRRIFQVLEDYG
jgi:hypothetical protein